MVGSDVLVLTGKFQNCIGTIQSFSGTGRSARLRITRKVAGTSECKHIGNNTGTLFLSALAKILVSTTSTSTIATVTPTVTPATTTATSTTTGNDTDVGTKVEPNKAVIAAVLTLLLLLSVAGGAIMCMRKKETNRQRSYTQGRAPARAARAGVLQPNRAYGNATDTGAEDADYENKPAIQLNALGLQAGSLNIETGTACSEFVSSTEGADYEEIDQNESGADVHHAGVSDSMHGGDNYDMSSSGHTVDHGNVVDAGDEVEYEEMDQSGSMSATHSNTGAVVVDVGDVHDEYDFPTGSPGVAGAVSEAYEPMEQEPRRAEDADYEEIDNNTFC